MGTFSVSTEAGRIVLELSPKPGCHLKTPNLRKCLDKALVQARSDVTTGINGMAAPFPAQNASNQTVKNRELFNTPG
ncbi:MAG: hypothetical protein ACE5FN_09265 [Leptospirillia bacterium]